jgi:hypothetical protein
MDSRRTARHGDRRSEPVPAPDAEKQELVCTGWGIATLMFVWFLIALGVGHAGILRDNPGATLGIGAPLLSVLALMPLGLVAPMRRWAMQLDLRALVWLHVSRLVGVLVLYYHARGSLPGGFALPAGWADVAVAVTAAALAVLALPLRGRDWRWWLVAIWNLLGLIGILVTLGGGLWAVRALPGSMAAVTELPLSLLPTFMVPVWTASHLLMLARLHSIR